MGASRTAEATDSEQPRAPTAPAASPDGGEATLRRLLPRMWPLFVTFWLVFIVTGPVATMLNEPLTPVRMLATLVWTVTFFAAYLWLTLHKPFRADLTPAERRTQIGLLVVLTGLVLYVDVAYPTGGWFWLFIYVLIPAGVILPTRAAVWTVVAITLLAGGVDAVRREWATVWSVPGIAFWGLSMIIVRRLVVTIDELRAAREELARLAVAEERLRFARDLHDLLGHSLSLITLKSELAGRLAHHDGERAAAEIADVERVARRALREVREAVAGYRRPTLGEELAGVRDMLTAAGIETRIDAAAGPLPPAIDAVLAWTVREGATNVIRHSRARHCEIRVTRADTTVRAEVIDDGRGTATAPPEAAGSGLSGLAERVAELEGRMDAGLSAEGGFRLQVVLPIGDDRAEATRGATVPGGAGAEGIGRR
jgi:two-component system sensor histidine kinase DesK